MFTPRLGVLLAFMLFACGASIPPPAPGTPCSQLLSDSANYMHSQGFHVSADQTPASQTLYFFRDMTGTKYLLWISLNDQKPRSSMTIESTGTCLEGSTPRTYYRLTTDYPCLTCNKL